MSMLVILIDTIVADGRESNTDSLTESLQIWRYSADLVKDTPAGQFHWQEKVVVVHGQTIVTDSRFSTVQTSSRDRTSHVGETKDSWRAYKSYGCAGWNRLTSFRGCNEDTGREVCLKSFHTLCHYRNL